MADSDRRWALIVPVDRLYLTEVVNREFRVDRVLFVHRDKLPYMRKRLGFGIRVSELKKETPVQGVLREIASLRRSEGHWRAGGSRTAVP